MCTKFAYDAYKEREKNMETTKEIRKVNGKQYMTINAIAEASGIARDSLTNRFYRFKKEYPEHTCHFGSKIPVYYDEYVLHLLVESPRIRPIRVIEDMDKYEKFYKTYKSKTYEVVDAEQTDFILDETAPVNKAVKKNKKKHDSKTEQQKVINSREEALSKLVQKQNYEITELKGKIADLTTQNAKLTLSLQEQKPDAELNEKYIALQEKYMKNTERFAEKIYQMANIISGFTELKSAKISNSAPERLSNVDDVFVG